jgi:hypothetical protein
MVKKGKLGSIVGGAIIKYTVAVVDNGKIVDKKNFSGNNFSLNDLMASLGNRDELIVKFEKEKYFDPFDRIKSEMEERMQRTFNPFGPSPFPNNGFDQGNSDVLYFKFKKSNKYSF